MTASQPAVPSLADFVRPVLGDDVAAAGATPLSRLPVGDFAVLAWLDDVQAHWYSADLDAELVARWNTATPQDVYTMLFTELITEAGAARVPSS